MGAGLGIKKGEPFPYWQGEFPRIVLSPKNDLEIKRAFGFAREEGLRAVIAGMGGRLSWLKRPSGGFLLIKTSLLKDVLNFDKANMTIEVGSGMPLSWLDGFLEDQGLFFPMDPFDMKGLSLGGAYQTNAFGGLSLGFGLIRDLVLGMELQSPGIERVHFGGHTIKNVSGYNLKRFLSGAFGELGVVTRLILRVFPRPDAEFKLRIAPKTLDGLSGLLGLVLQESTQGGRALLMGVKGDDWPRVWVGFMGSGALGELKAERLKDRLVSEGVEADVELEEKGPFYPEWACVEGFMGSGSLRAPDGLLGFGLEASVDLLKALKGFNGSYLVYPHLGRAFVWGLGGEWANRLKGLGGVKVHVLPFKGLEGVGDDPKERVLVQIKRMFDPDGILGAGLIP